MIQIKYKPPNIICFFLKTQAALLKRTNNESVLAIQPHHQADQPNKNGPKVDQSGGLWKTLLIWGAVVIGILCLAAVVPLCHYGGRLRPQFLGSQPQIFVQRLVGEF